MSNRYTEHTEIVTDDFKMIDATTSNGIDLIWIEIDHGGGAWFTHNAAMELAESLSKILSGHRARLNAAVPAEVITALDGRDLMITSNDVLKRIAEVYPGQVADYINNVISERSLIAA
jgi:hypothetical protein